MLPSLCFIRRREKHILMSYASVALVVLVVLAEWVNSQAPPVAGGNTTTTTTIAPSTNSPVTLQPSTMAPTTPSPTNATLTAQTIQYPIIIGGGAAIFVLLIGACYVTLMWQQKALRLYKANFEEAIKERGKARREIQNVFLRGENRVFDYKAKDDSDEEGGDKQEMDDMSPVAMRARILGQEYHAVKFVERTAVHPMTQGEHPSSYVGKGPVYYPPTLGSGHLANGGDDEDASGDRWRNKNKPTFVFAPSHTSLASSYSTPSRALGGQVSSSLFDGDSTIMKRTPPPASGTGSGGITVDNDRAPPSSVATIIANARMVHAAVQELKSNPTLKHSENTLL